MLHLILLALLIGAAVGVVLWLFDIHIAVYRPKLPGRTTYFYAEIGSPSTSQLNVPPEKE